MKSGIKHLFNALNKAEWSRSACYTAWRLFLAGFRFTPSGAGAFLLVYRFHLKLLQPYFDGSLNQTSASCRLAQKCNKELLQGFRLRLSRTSDDDKAKSLNKAVNDFENFKQLNRLASYPYRINIEMTDHCNLQCPMCALVVLEYNKQHISLDTIRRIQPVLRYMDQINLVGCGETFMHPNLREIIRMIPHGTTETRIITNGILLNEEMIRFLIDQELDQIWFSVDAVDAETFAQVRDSQHFERILENIRTLQRLKAEQDRKCPHVAMTFVARKCNIKQLSDYVRLTHELGGEAIHVGYMIVYDKELIPESLYFHQELSDRMMIEAKQEAERLGIEFHGPRLFSDPVAPEQDQRQTDDGPPETTWSHYNYKCAEPYNFVFVANSGALKPCCVNPMGLGSLDNSSFDELWNSAEYVQFRRSVNTPEEDLHCKHCAMEINTDVGRIDHHIKILDKHSGVIEQEIDYEKIIAKGPST